MTNLADIPAALLLQTPPDGFGRTNPMTNEYGRRLGSSGVEGMIAAPTMTLAAYARPPAVVRGEGRHLPAIVREILPRLLELSRLKPGWDSYGAQPLEPRAVAFLLNILLAATPGEVMVHPQVFPTSSGGLQLEWDRGASHLELRIGPGAACFYFEDEDSHSDVFETKTSLEGAAEALTRLMARLHGSPQ